MTTTAVEAEWDQQSRDEAMALGVYEDTLCPKCDGPRSECQDPGTEDNWLPDLPIRCNKTAAYVASQKPYSDSDDADALLFSIRHRNDLEAARRYAEAKPPPTDVTGAASD